jgi:mercuric reductase
VPNGGSIALLRRRLVAKENVMPEEYDLIVIGSGSAASSGWLYASSLGKRVAVFEKDVLGGECPTFACVPTKALLHSAEVRAAALAAGRFGVHVPNAHADYSAVKRWKDLVVSRTGAARGEAPFEEAGVDLYRREARFVSADEVEAGGSRFRASSFLVATGSVPRIPAVPGLAEAGFLTFRDAIDLTDAPERVCILGGGPVGCEFAQIFNSFGVEVFLVNRPDRLLAREDPEVGELLGSLFSERGVNVFLGATATRVEVSEGAKTVVIQHGQHQTRIGVDQILVATGKQPALDLGLDRAGIEYSEGGITVDAHLRTTNPSVFAAGDCVGPYKYAHAASYQGRVAVHNAFHEHQVSPDYTGMPRCVFTSPEVATAGLTEREVQEQDIPYRVGLAGIGSLGRANTTEEFDGFVKVLAREDGRLLGAAIVSPRAGEMIHELVLAIRTGLTAADVARTIHAFPTFSEAIGEACARVA